MKKVLGVHTQPRQHWVGDGFPVRSLFSYQSHAQQLSPFLLLDHAGPASFTPTDKPRGVGQHPHRGFETVTVVYKGEVSHQDSTGQGGTIGPGDVQWMTAGSGILHEEFHSEAFSRNGGDLEMVQLWVNLPAKDKMTQPGYQAIQSKDIPTVALPNGAGHLRLIAGQNGGFSGPAHTFSPLQVCDVQLNAGAVATLDVAEGWSAALVVLSGEVRVNGQHAARAGQWVLLDQQGANLGLEAETNAVVLLLSGEPLNEPVVGYGPFVMNTREQIETAMADFNRGRFGQMPA
jgi:quercetin 2,3-dioxygenase